MRLGRPPSRVALHILAQARMDIDDSSTNEIRQRPLKDRGRVSDKIVVIPRSRGFACRAARRTFDREAVGSFRFLSLERSGGTPHLESLRNRKMATASRMERPATMRVHRPRILAMTILDPTVRSTGFSLAAAF